MTIQMKTVEECFSDVLFIKKVTIGLANEVV